MEHKEWQMAKMLKWKGVPDFVYVHWKIVIQIAFNIFQMCFNH